MTLTATATQLSNSSSEIVWTTTDLDPVAGFEVSIDIDSVGFLDLATLSGTARRFVDISGLWTPGQTVAYRVTDLDTAQTVSTPTRIANDLDVPWTYGPSMVDSAVPRYTTLDAVKIAIGIPITDLGKDDELLEAILSGESSIDRELGRSFPDQGTNPQIQYVPAAVASLAKKSAVAIYTGDRSPFGTAGSDEWLGAVSVADVISRTIRRSPLLRGFQVSFGFA